jgi:hypothetical protein
MKRASPRSQEHHPTRAAVQEQMSNGSKKGMLVVNAGNWPDLTAVCRQFIRGLSWLIHVNSTATLSLMMRNPPLGNTAARSSRRQLDCGRFDLDGLAVSPPIPFDAAYRTKRVCVSCMTCRQYELPQIFMFLVTPNSQIG